MFLDSRLSSRKLMLMATKVLIIVPILFLIFTNFGIVMINSGIETFLVDTKDITEGSINEFYVGMSRLSVIEVIEKSVPSSVEAISDVTFNISEINSGDWKKVGINTDLGIMQTHGDEILIKINNGKAESVNCVGRDTELCTEIHVGDKIEAIESEIKDKMNRGDNIRLFPILFDKPQYLSIDEIRKEGYKSLSGYNGWKIRYHHKDKADTIYDLIFINDIISRIRYEHSNFMIGE